MFAQMRIAWKIGNSSGHGDWLKWTLLEKSTRREVIKEMNKEYGQGTHWIEERPARQPDRA